MSNGNGRRRQAPPRRPRRRCAQLPAAFHRSLQFRGCILAGLARAREREGRRRRSLPALEELLKRAFYLPFSLGPPSHSLLYFSTLEFRASSSPLPNPRHLFVFEPPTLLYEPLYLLFPPFPSLLCSSLFFFILLSSRLLHPFYSLLFPPLFSLVRPFPSKNSSETPCRPDLAAYQSERDQLAAKPWSNEDARSLSVARSVSRFYVCPREARETDKRMVLILKPLAPPPILASTPSATSTNPKVAFTYTHTHTRALARSPLFLPFSSCFRHFLPLDSAR